VAFVSDRDVYVTRVSTGQEVRLTHSNTGTDSASSEPLSSGIPSYVMQEEFNRFTGLWWRPTCDDGCYSLLYERVDESEVEVIRFSGTAMGEADEEMRFPRAGAPNAKSTLRIVDFEFSLQPGSEGFIMDVRRRDLASPLESYFPWMEYLVRAGWDSTGSL